MEINIDLKKYNVFFENNLPVAIEIKDSKRISNLLKIYKLFKSIPDEETVNVIYLEKVDSKFVLQNLKKYEIKVNSLDRPSLLRTTTN